MNKEIKKAYSFIEEKENRRNQNIAKAEADLKSCKEKLYSLNTALEKADNAETYKSLLQDIRDYEATKEFCEKKLSEAKAPVLSPEEHSQLVKVIRSSFADYQKDQRSVIFAEIEKLVNLLYAYDSEVTDLNNLIIKVNSLYKLNVLSMFNAQTITANDPDERCFIEAFYKMKSSKELMKVFNVRKE